MDTKILEEIGLTQGEIKTYLALLKLGSTSTGPLAKTSQVSRSKLYIILDKLEKKGLASHIERRGVLYWQGADPIRVNEYVQEKQEVLKQLQKDFTSFLPQLQSLQEETSAAKVRVYQGLKGLTTVHEYMYLKLKKGDTYYSIGIPSTQPEPHHLFWQRDHRRRSEQGIKAQLLFNQDVKKETVKNRNSYDGCDARYLPIDVNTPSYVEMYADTTLIVIPTSHPLTIEIISKEVTDSFMSYFKEFWKRSKKIIASSSSL